VNFSTKTTATLTVTYLLPVKGTMCETRINIEMFLVSIYSKLLVSVGITNKRRGSSVSVVSPIDIGD